MRAGKDLFGAAGALRSNSERNPVNLVRDALSLDLFAEYQNCNPYALAGHKLFVKTFWLRWKRISMGTLQVQSIKVEPISVIYNVDAEATPVLLQIITCFCFHIPHVRACTK